MSLPQPTLDNSTTAPTSELGSLVTDFVAAIQADDVETMTQLWDRTNQLSRPAPAAVVEALKQSGVADQLLDAFVRRSGSVNTADEARRAAEVAFAFGNDAVAFAAATETRRREPRKIAATQILAVIANRQGKPDEALKVIDELITLVPELRAEPNLAIQNAIAQLATDNADAALKTLDKNSVDFVRAGLACDAQVLRARAFGILPNQTKAAQEAWEKALSLATPEQENLLRYEFSGVLWKAEKYDEALQQLELAVQATSDQAGLAKLHEARFNVFFAKGNLEAAIGALEDQLANVTSSDVRVGLRLAQAQLEVARRNWKDAAARFDSALAEVPQGEPQKRLDIHLAKAQALATHDYELVKADLDELDRKATGSEWPRAIDVRIGGLLANDRTEEALVWLDNQLSASADLANHPAAHQVRGDVAMKLGNVEAALKEYAQATNVPSGTTDPRAWGAALVGAFMTQKWEVAISVYEQFVKLNPAAVEPPAQIMAAVAYVRSDQPQVALQLTEGDEPLPPVFSLLKAQTRAEAQLRLNRYEDVLKTTAGIEQRQDASPDFILGSQLMRIQALNQLKRFPQAEKTATAVLASFTDSTNTVQGLMPFLRLGVLVQRSLAFFSLSKYRQAHADLDDAISGFETLRSSVAVKMLEKATEFASFESSIWYAKGAVFEAELRNDEALNAFNRSFRMEVNGCAAAIARGYALSKVGAFTDAVNSFDVALSRVTSSSDRARALTGKGLVFVRLRRFEQAMTTLQSALDARLAEPESDDPTRRDDTSVVFEYLGIAYSELNRNGAALNSFRRAWKLTPENKRDKDKANVARGISAARLKLGDPSKVLGEWAQLHKDLKNDPTLLFNRALALDATGKRPEAMKDLVRAQRLGLRQAQELLNQLDRPTGLNRWTREWLGVQVSPMRRVCGALLLIVAGFGLGAPFYQWLMTSKLDWYWLLLPSAAALLLFALPSIRSIKAAGVELLAAEPLAATGRDASTPETFNFPTLATPIAAESKFV